MNQMNLKIVTLPSKQKVIESIKTHNSVMKKFVLTNSCSKFKNLVFKFRTYDLSVSCYPGWRDGCKDVQLVELLSHLTLKKFLVLKNLNIFS